MIAKAFQHVEQGDHSRSLFERSRQEIFESTDRMFGKFLAVQWVIGIFFAITISPHTWVGRESEIHLHVWAAIFLGGVLSAFPFWMTRAYPGWAPTRYVVATSQMLMSALLICLTGGRIETHFHISATLVFLSYYRDWKVFIPATMVIGLDHFVRGIYWPMSVYGVLTASPWRSVEHTAWIVFEEGFLVFACFRSLTEMRSIAHRTSALEESDQNSRQIFSEAPMGMAVIGLDKRFQQVNAVLAEMLGYTERELLAISPLDLSLPEDVEATEESSEFMLATSQHVSSEKRFVRKDGSLIWVMRTECVIRDAGGKPRHFLIMVQDISQQREAAVALQTAKELSERANEAKSEFLSRMSHELRTPLNAILGFGQLLERQQPSDKQLEHLRHITGAGRHLLDLINEVLDISRIESGQMELSLEPINLSEALHETLDLMRPAALESSINLVMELGADDRCFAFADKQRFKQVVLNLLTNAVKYSPRDTKVTISYDLSHDDTVRVLVRDQGPGIPEDKRARLFTPFDRLGVEKSGVQGTGLGLAVSRRLMEAMNGTVGAEPAPGGGSIFWIEFIRAAHQPAHPARAPRDPAVVSGRRRILYIEDNRSNVELVERILEEHEQFELAVAVNGYDGIARAREQRPDIILLDLHLPDISGLEVLMHMRADQSLRDVPVIVLSADATNRQIERLANAGATRYLTKPLDVARFLQALTEISLSHQPESGPIAA